MFLMFSSSFRRAISHHQAASTSVSMSPLSHLVCYRLLLGWLAVRYNSKGLIALASIEGTLLVVFCFSWRASFSASVRIHIYFNRVLHKVRQLYWAQHFSLIILSSCLLPFNSSITKSPPATPSGCGSHLLRLRFP